MIFQCSEKKITLSDEVSQQRDRVSKEPDRLSKWWDESQSDPFGTFFTRGEQNKVKEDK